jgi:hypothetical protein
VNKHLLTQVRKEEEKVKQIGIASQVDFFLGSLNSL